MKVRQTIFTKETRHEFISGTQKVFSLPKRSKQSKEGDLIILQDITEKSVFAVARLGKFENGSVMREHSQLDPDTHKKLNLNKFELAIAELKILPKAISFTDLAFLLGIDNTIKYNNITKNTQFNFHEPMYHGSNKEDVVKRLEIWVKTLIQ